MSRGREIRNHLPDGPEQAERDAALAKGDPLRESAWLYGHDLEADLPAQGRRAGAAGLSPASGSGTDSGSG
jgi:hypothetical protein